MYKQILERRDEWQCLNNSILSSSPVKFTTADSPNLSDDTTVSSSDGRYKYSHQFTWEKHSSGVASKILNQQGYQGKGLGKAGDGITEPIRSESAKFIQSKENRKIVYILSDSMLNRLEQKRLSDKRFDVRLECHGGCTVGGMFRHLDAMIKCNPEYVLLHVGTNSCVNTISDDVLKELKRLKDHIQVVLPKSRIYFSLPTRRTDDNRANTIILNLNTKLKKLGYFILDNSNIRDYHLGKKGLHLNDYGTKQMASNIISFIRRL